MSAPVCPTTLELKNLIEFYSDAVKEYNDETSIKTVNALRYLETFLSNRRMYQRKMQVKRSVLLKLANEQGWMEQIDNAVKAIHGDDLEKLSLEDKDDDADQ